MAKRFSHIVLGLGATGLSVVRHLCGQGISPLVMDSRRQPPGAEQLAREFPNVELRCGGFDCRLLIQASLIVISPGIALDTPEVQAATDMGVEVVGDIELFARALTTRSAKVIGITGSNGKSTVTTLVHDMAKVDGMTVAMGGNIGIPALSLLEQDAELYVLELSSFQLETTTSLECVSATCLNISEDHMDRYVDFQAYRHAKLKLYKQTQQILFNRDDELTRGYEEVLCDSNIEQVSFGLNEPEGKHWGIDDAFIFHGQQRVMGLLDVCMIGLHNQANILAAMALSSAAGVSESAMVKVAKTFTGLEHRCEVVGVHKGVVYVNDSKATNVGATIAALDGLSGYLGNVFLIVGGDGKGADFSGLQEPFNGVEQIFTLGKDGDKLAELKPGTIKVKTMAAAVKKAANLAKEGDMVLLSPACASIDMYENFMARGKDFCRLVESLDVK